MKDIPTPRCDAIANKVHKDAYDAFNTILSEARTLERELYLANATIEQYRRTYEPPARSTEE